jgi:hypothetical protein
MTPPMACLSNTLSCKVPPERRWNVALSTTIGTNDADAPIDYDNDDGDGSDNDVMMMMMMMIVMV